MGLLTCLWCTCLLNDYVMAHKSKVVQNFLKEEKLFSFHIYLSFFHSSPCDFFLSPKKKLAGRCHSSKSTLWSAFFSVSKVYMLETTKKPFQTEWLLWRDEIKWSMFIHTERGIESLSQNFAVACHVMSSNFPMYSSKLWINIVFSIFTNLVCNDYSQPPQRYRLIRAQQSHRLRASSFELQRCW